MENQEYEQNEWKVALQSEILTAMTGSADEKAHAYAEVGYYYECCAQALLYKYYSGTPLHMSSIKNKKMWYSAPCNFNDVFDCDISIDEKKVFNEAIKLFPDKRGMRPGSKMWKDFRAEMNQRLRALRAEFNELRSTMGVSCLSESEDSMLMWAHYANNHRGICVEYDLFDINRILGFTAVPVIYSMERPCFDSFNLEDIEKDAMQLFIRSLTTKSPEWCYEKEWRIIRDQNACGDRWDIGKRGALLDMIQPSSIILGCAAEEKLEQEVKEYCYLNKINLYKMEKDSMQYRLNKKAVLEFDGIEGSILNFV